MLVLENTFNYGANPPVEDEGISIIFNSDKDYRFTGTGPVLDTNGQIKMSSEFLGQAEGRGFKLGFHTRNASDQLLENMTINEDGLHYCRVGPCRDRGG